MNGATPTHGSARTPRPAVAAARLKPAHRVGRSALLRARSQRRAPVLLYIVTPGRYFLSHRLTVACAAAAAGWDVHVAAPAGDAVDRITHAQITVHDTRLYRSVVSPFNELSSLLALIRLCRRIQPSLIHAVAPKAAVLGGLTARALGIPAVIMKGGLCTTDTAPGIANAIASLAIRAGIYASVSKRAILVVQNAEEFADLARSPRIRTRTALVAGAGVNCTAFRATSEPKPPVTVVLPARMLKSKGVPEFVEAARLLRARGIDARFLLAGRIDLDNSSAVQPGEIRAWEREGLVEWLGHCDNMPLLLERCHIVCLPGHGEGLSKALAEGAAAARPIVTTDVAGCRDVVQPGVNGLLVPPRDPNSLAAALATLILDSSMRTRFGRAGRDMALARFDERLIIPRMLSLYRSLRETEP